MVYGGDLETSPKGKENNTPPGYPYIHFGQEKCCLGLRFCHAFCLTRPLQLEESLHIVGIAHPSVRKLIIPNRCIQDVPRTLSRPSGMTASYNL
jgi:hypothetical protein